MKLDTKKEYEINDLLYLLEINQMYGDLEIKIKEGKPVTATLNISLKLKENG